MSDSLFHGLVATTVATGGNPPSGSWALLVIYFCLAIGVSFFCSVWEAVLLSLTDPYIATLKNERPKVGDMLERLKTKISAPLTSILTLNTIAHTMGAIGVGAQVVGLTGGGIWEAVSGALMTLAVLILSEIIPKNLGARHWRAWAPWVGRSLTVLTRMMTPFTKVVEAFAPAGHVEPQFSRDELKVMGELGRRQGDLREDELRILQNLLQLRDSTVHAIMTPRVVVFALPDTMTVGEFMESFAEKPFSRIPIYSTDLDDVKGFVLKNEILAAAAEGKNDELVSQFLRDVPNVPATTPVSHAFEIFLTKRYHLAVVLDEYGGVDGVVTMEDLIETLIGLEIVDEADTAEDMQKRARTLWRRRAARMGLEVDAPGSEPSGD